MAVQGRTLDETTRRMVLPRAAARLPQREIAKQCQISKTTANKYILAAKKGGPVAG